MKPYVIFSVHSALPFQKIESFWFKENAQKVCRKYNKFAKLNFSYKVVKMW